MVAGAWKFRHIGVVLFLVISGCIIPVSLERGGSNARFWLRRFFRLFPAYWLSIAIGYCYMLGGNNPPMEIAPDNTSGWLLNLTMLQGFLKRPNVWGVFWTLKIELVLYAICSLLFAFRLSKHWVALVTTAIAIYALVGLLRPFISESPFGIGGQKYLYWSPLMGVLAQCYISGRLARRQMVTLLGFQMGSLLIVWTVNHCCFPAEMSTRNLYEYLFTWGTAYACFFALVELRGLHMPGAGCWFGRISYSLYLLHPAVLLMISSFPLWLKVSAFIAGSLVLAELSYRFVELPGIALGRVLERRFWPPKRLSPPLPLRQAA